MDKKQSGNRISICKGGWHNQVHISSRSDFFTPNEYIIVIVDHEKITFKKPSLFYTGKLHKIKPTQSGWVCFDIIADIPLARRLAFDPDESNEDQVVVYYR